MIEIRIHGRGGQGAVSASTMLATAAHKAGRYVQAFAVYGAERRGAPMVAFVRVDDAPIRLRQMVYQPNGTIVLDSTLLALVDVTAGLVPGGWVLLNAPEGRVLPAALQPFTVYAVDATAIAADLGLGTRAMPMVNTAILGAVARFGGLADLSHVLFAIPEIVPAKVDANLEAARVAFDRVHCPASPSPPPLPSPRGYPGRGMEERGRAI
ncbi:MAG: 2-oxoacid:acceptor oxidoreductase family protein [candidate division NC10 bacterium]|nr:2-oxoacid:acceptor oxidoreductase family protein [candidate division NC10 bacterium]